MTFRILGFNVFHDKLVEYNFTVTWVSGKSHHIADILSWAPLLSPEETEDMHIDSVRVCMTWVPGKSHHIADALSWAPLLSPEETEDMHIDSVRVCMELEFNYILDANDSDYVKFRHDVLNGTELSPYSKQKISVKSAKCGG